MTNLDDLLSLDFYKKSPYFGSDGNMRFKIFRDEDNFIITSWKGPMNFDTTTEEKIDHTEPFTQEGLQAICDYINEKASEY
ncbi:MAG: GNAT family acetyltransferase [Lachnospiraceae bacterium]|nr:GNAT family acetyltransferase [Lachnospiraceae bacterium]